MYYKTLEELFVAEYEILKAEVKRLEGALKDAKHTIAELSKERSRLIELIKPTLRRAYSEPVCVVDFTNIWENDDEFNEIVEMLGFEESLEELKKEGAKDEPVRD